jgi:hypothetical protein
MLAEIGDSPRYVAYILLSQFSHGSHFAGSIYRRGLGTEKKFATRISASDWVPALEICWWSLFHATAKIEHVCAGRELRSVPQSLLEAIDSRFGMLRGEAPC